MAYMRDASAIRVGPLNPPIIAKAAVAVAPPRRTIAKDVAQKPAAKPKSTDWREVMRASHRRAEAIAAQYSAAGKAWGRNGDADPYAATGAVYENMMAAYEAKIAPLQAKEQGVEGSAFGENFTSIMSRYDGAKSALRSAQRDPAAERKSIADARAFHQEQLARNERFAAAMKDAANAKWGRR